jgi:hypothetical protein
MSSKKVTGPIQVFVIGFDRFEASGQIMAELRRVRKRGVIRLVDLLFVQKDRQGNISSSMHMTDLSEAERERLGAVAGGLIGLRAGGPEGAAVGAELGALAVTWLQQLSRPTAWVSLDEQDSELPHFLTKPSTPFIPRYVPKQPVSRTRPGFPRPSGRSGGPVWPARQPV